MKAKLLVSFLIFGMMVSFQNCGGVKFSNATASISNSKLTAMASESDPATNLVVDPGTSSSGPSQLPPVVANPPVSNTNSDGSTDAKHDGGCSKNDDQKNNDVRKQQDEPQDSQDLVACILDGNGKSIKLGLIQDKFDGVNAVAKSVCITRHACLDIVPTKFDVKEADDRGYCEGNPNVVRLTDQEVADLLK